jgi:flagellar motor switch protein FliN/FliY
MTDENEKGTAREGSQALVKSLGGQAIQDVEVQVQAVLGRATLRVHQMLKLGRGAVVEFRSKTDDPVELYVDNVLIGKGEVIVTPEDKIGVTLTEVVKAQN